MAKFLWRPLATAPKDGTKILACGSGGPEWEYDPLTVSYRTYHPNAAGKATWRDSAGHKAGHLTHWMPLPEYPDLPANEGPEDALVQHLRDALALEGTEPDVNPDFCDSFTEKHWWNKLRRLIAQWTAVQATVYRLPLEDGERYCHSSKDGEVCNWEKCPQMIDSEPAKTGRHCPLDADFDASSYDPKSKFRNARVM